MAWASVRGFVEFGSISGAVARWTRLDEQGRERLIMATGDSRGFWETHHVQNQDSDLRMTTSATNDPRQYILAAWSCCIEAPLPQISRSGVSPSCTSMELTQRWSTYGDFWREAHGNQSFPVPKFAAEYFIPGPERILVRTSVANLQMLRKPWHELDTWYPAESWLFDSSGWCMGTCKCQNRSLRRN